MSPEVAAISSLAVAMVLDWMATSSAADAMASVVERTMTTESRTRSATEKNCRMAWFMSVIMVLKAVARRTASFPPPSSARTDRSPPAARSSAAMIPASGLKALRLKRRIRPELAARSSRQIRPLIRMSPRGLKMLIAATLNSMTTALLRMIRAVADMSALSLKTVWRQGATQKKAEQDDARSRLLRYA